MPDRPISPASAIGIAFAALVFFVAAYTFAPRPLPDFPATVVKPETLLLLDAARAGTRIVTAGERGYIFLSDNEGESWRQARAPGSATLTALHFQDPQRGWAVGHDAVILQTVDGGETWRLAHSAPSEEKPLLQIFFLTPAVGYATGAYGSFYVTVDGGATWQLKKISDDDKHLNALSRSGDNALILAGEGGSLRRSDDAGETWATLPSPYHGSFFGVLSPSPGLVLAYGLRGNIFRSNDLGLSWAKIESGSFASLLGGRILSSGVITLVGQDGTMLVSRDGGASFTRQPAADDKALAAIIETRRNLLLFGESGITRSALPFK